MPKTTNRASKSDTPKIKSVPPGHKAALAHALTLLAELLNKAPDGVRTWRGHDRMRGVMFERRAMMFGHHPMARPMFRGPFNAPFRGDCMPPMPYMAATLPQISVENFLALTGKDFNPTPWIAGAFLANSIYPVIDKVTHAWRKNLQDAGYTITRPLSDVVQEVIETDPRWSLLRAAQSLRKATHDDARMRHAMDLLELRIAAQTLPASATIPLNMDISAESLALLQPGKGLMALLRTLSTTPGIAAEAKNLLLGLSIGPGKANAPAPQAPNQAEVFADVQALMPLVSNREDRKDVAKAAAALADGVFVRTKDIQGEALMATINRFIDGETVEVRAKIRTALQRTAAQAESPTVESVQRAFDQLPRAQRVSLLQALIGRLG